MPTMEGFAWTSSGVSSSGAGYDNWCVRDSMCLLFGWPRGSDEWSAFIEGPSPDDTERLIDHLGLLRVDPLIPRHFAWLVANLKHPGISRYNFRDRQVSHAQYEPDLAAYRGLPPQYVDYENEAELIGFLVDPSQPPHA